MLLVYDWPTPRPVGLTFFPNNNGLPLLVTEFQLEAFQSMDPWKLGVVSNEKYTPSDHELPGSVLPGPIFDTVQLTVMVCPEVAVDGACTFETTRSGNGSTLKCWIGPSVDWQGILETKLHL